jgi:hypothetical protein
MNIDEWSMLNNIENMIDDLDCGDAFQILVQNDNSEFSEAIWLILIFKLYEKENIFYIGRPRYHPMFLDNVDMNTLFKVTADDILTIGI